MQVEWGGGALDAAQDGDWQDLSAQYRWDFTDGVGRDVEGGGGGGFCLCGYADGLKEV